MTRQRALRLAREWAQDHKCTLRDREAAEYHSMFAAMLEESMPNEPLTLEQLREMGGQPVYMPDTNCWALVTQNAFCPILTFPDGEKCSVYDWYEQVGPVYRRPPEAKDNNVPTNEPLTIEELREMDGEPVYVHNLFPAKRKFEWQWALVCKERGNAEATTYTYRFLDYGKTWIAYRRPPEGGEINKITVVQHLGRLEDVAFRPVSRERVEMVWRGEWMQPIFGDQQDANDPRFQCSECGSIETPLARHKFCPNCGAPMTGEAVEMVMERLEALYGQENT